VQAVVRQSKCPTPFLATRAGRLTKDTPIVAARNHAGSFPRQQQLFVQPVESVMKNLFNRFVKEDAGQDLIEYALLAGLISLVCVLAISAAGTKVSTLFVNVETSIP